jgi:hypothetical protein
VIQIQIKLTCTGCFRDRIAARQVNDLPLSVLPFSLVVQREGIEILDAAIAALISNPCMVKCVTRFPVGQAYESLPADRSACILLRGVWRLEGSAAG